MAEIIRAGIISVDEGQTEAAQSLGMSRLSALRLIVLPQAMRVVIPPTGNETISMLKTSSLASVVVAPELLYRVEQIYAANYYVIPLAHGGQPSISVGDVGPHGGAVLPRTSLCPRRGPPAPPNAIAAAEALAAHPSRRAQDLQVVPPREPCLQAGYPP